MAHFVFHSEENYLKAIFKLMQQEGRKPTNSALANLLGLNPATVLEMVRKMEARGMARLLSDKSIQLTEEGRTRALITIRKHRLWEVFLVDRLGYKWDEVHDLAEQLEHVESNDLIDRLDSYLGHPPFDPHGDPIPDKEGRLQPVPSLPLSKCALATVYVVQHFAETSDAFLAYLQQVQVKPGSRIKITGINEFDQSFNLLLGKKKLVISEKVAANILVLPASEIAASQ